MACEGCCRVDQNETTYNNEKANMKDDQVILAAPPLRQTANVASQVAPPTTATMTAADFAGAWEDQAKSVCIISDSCLRWSTNAISKITVTAGVLRLLDDETTATLDATKNSLTWSDGDIWKRTAVAALFAGAWIDDSKAVHTIVGTTLKWSNNTISDIKFIGGQLQLDENGLKATLDESKTKLTWSDGDVWNKTDRPQNCSDFVGVWKDADDKCHTITDTTLNWSNTRSSIVKVEDGVLNVDGCTATLDENKTRLIWSDGDSWTKTPSRLV